MTDGIARWIKNWYISLPINGQTSTMMQWIKNIFVVVGISGNAALSRETNNGEIKWDNLIGAKTYGHCLCNTKWDIDYKKAVDNYNYTWKGIARLKNHIQGNEYKVYMNVYKGNIYQASGFVILPKPTDKEEIKKTEWL